MAESRFRPKKPRGGPQAHCRSSQYMFSHLRGLPKTARHKRFAVHRNKFPPGPPKVSVHSVSPYTKCLLACWLFRLLVMAVQSQCIQNWVYCVLWCSGCIKHIQDTPHSLPSRTLVHKSSPWDPGPPRGRIPFSAEKAPWRPTGTLPRLPIHVFAPPGPA